MKGRYLAAALGFLLAFGMAGCRDIDDSSKAKRPELDKAFRSEAPQTQSSFADLSSADTSSDTSSDESSQSSGRGAAHAEIGFNGAKAVKEVYLYSDEQALEGKAEFEDLYGRHALHTGVVGLVGAPIDVRFDTDDVKGGRLVFYVDRNELHGIRPDALMFMWYDESNDNYVENGKTEIREESDDTVTASIDIDKPGVYLLVNKYTWLNAWGAGLDDDGYEKGYVPGADDIAPSGDWENNESTGDIIKLLDKDYLMESLYNGSSADFRVSTAEQLATACYYVNCCKLDRGNPPHIEITLEADIDLKGISWAPMGWDMAGSDHRFTGIINGNGYTIKNLSVDTQGNAGFIGDALRCVVIDLKFENASISGRKSGIVLGSDLSSTIQNIECSGTVTGSMAGPLAGDGTDTRFYDCKADAVTVNGESFGEYFSYWDKDRAKVSEEFGKPEKLTVKGSKVIREAGLENKYDNIGWDISTGLSRNAENETELDLSGLYGKGEYIVELTAFINGYYIPISEPVTVKVE